MGYRIKTVAKLTGVPRNTLLAWERRYDLVSPARLDNGYREYSDSDISSLLSVKRLLDQGYKVSEAINLIKEAREIAQGDLVVPGSVRIAVLHPTLVEQLAAASDGLLPLRVVAEATSAELLLALLEATDTEDADTEDADTEDADTDDGDPDERVRAPGVDLLVADLAALGSDPVTTLQTCLAALGTPHAIVTYQFATYGTLQRLIAAGARLVSGSARVTVVQQAIREQIALQQAVAPTRPALPAPAEGESVGVPRRFTDSQLARMRELRSSIDCECPNHIASLVTALLAFEEYSRSCESRGADDARLHARLATETGHAREIMEDLLVAICEQDRITI